MAKNVNVERNVNAADAAMERKRDAAAIRTELTANAAMHAVVNNSHYHTWYIA